MLTLGHDRKTQEPVTLDASHARVVLVCGKRGSGKSYTLGVLAEELFAQQPRPMILLVDPMGIFWTMAQPFTVPVKGVQGSPSTALGTGRFKALGTSRSLEPPPQNLASSTPLRRTPANAVWRADQPSGVAGSTMNLEPVHTAHDV